MIPGRRYSIGTVARLVWSGKWVLLACAAIGVALPAWYVSRLPDVYRSGATVLVIQPVIPANMVRSTVTQPLEERLRTLSDRVFLPENLARIATAVQPYPALAADPQAAGQRLRNAASVDMVRADAFRVTFAHGEPVIAARVTHQLAQSFVDENLRERTGVAEETERFIEAQLERTLTQLSEHETKLEDYRRTYAGQLPSQLTSNLQVIQNAQAQLRGVADSIREERDRKQRLEQALDALDASVPAPSAAPPLAFDPLVDEATQLQGREAQQALPGVRAQLRSLQLQLKDEHPDVVRVKRILAELERRAAMDVGTGGADAAAAANRDARATQARAQLAAAERRLATLEREETQLRNQMAQYQQRVEMIPSRETELTALVRDYDSLRQNYQELLTKREQSQLATELERRKVGESMRIADPARVPTEPFSPNRPRAMIQGLLIGLGLGVLFLGWREFQHQALRTEAEVVAALEVPVIAFIPIIPSAGDGRVRRRVAVATILGLGLAAGVLVYVFGIGGVL